MRRMLHQELRQAAHQRLDVVITGHMHHVLAVQLGLDIGSAQVGGDFLLYEFRLSFFQD